MSYSTRAPFVEEVERSSGFHQPCGHRRDRRGDKTENSYGEEFSDDKHGHLKVDEWKKALENHRAEKKSKSGMTIVSPFSKKVRDSLFFAPILSDEY